jgi:hypothetical protein
VTTRPRAADDFATIRARIEELRREREIVGAGDGSGEETGDGHAAAAADPEQRRRRRVEGWPPPWAPTIFVRRPRR